MKSSLGKEETRSPLGLVAGVARRFGSSGEWLARLGVCACLVLAAHESRANSAIAVNDRTGGFYWRASGAPPNDLARTVYRYFTEGCGRTPTQVRATATEGWTAVAVHPSTKKVGFVLGARSEARARSGALRRAGTGARLVFSYAEDGRHSLRAAQCAAR